MFINGSTAYKVQPIETNYDFSDEQSVSSHKKTDAFGLSNLHENKHPISEKLTSAMIEKANKALTNSDRKLEYKIHEATKQVMVKVINKETGDIVREIPNEKILDMVASMCRTAGILVDEKR